MSVVHLVINGNSGGVGQRLQPARRVYRQFALGVVVALALCSQAMAASFVVSSLSDSGTGSLRDAITQVNANPGTAPHTVDMTGITGAIQLGSELPTVNVDTTFNGPTTGTLRINRNAGSAFSILSSAESTAITVTRLTITNGLAQAGGGVNAGGTLTVRFCTFNNNSAVGEDVQDFGEGYSYATSAWGGAIACAGALLIEDSTLFDNTAQGGSSAYSGQSGEQASGGAISGADTVTLVRSTLYNNSAQGGNAIDNTSGDASGGAVESTGALSLQSCTIYNNSATGGANTDGTAGSGNGGALFSQSTVVADDTVINSNYATGGSALGTLSPSAGTAAGGAVLSYYEVNFNGCEISSNVAQAGDVSQGSGGYAAGGGVYVSDDYTITNSTLTGNSARAGGKVGTTAAAATGGSANGGALYACCGESATITGSTIASNDVTGGAGWNSNGGSAAGGGIYTTLPTTITSTDIDSNIVNAGNGQVAGESGYAAGGSARGGGIFANNPMILVSGSVSANYLAGGGSIGDSAGNASGGGIYCNDELTVTGTSIQSNQAIGGTDFGGFASAGNAQGGGICVSYSLSLTNATVNNNTADGGSSSSGFAGSAEGGGIFQNYEVTLTITGSTISNNLANADSEAFYGGGANGGGVFSGYSIVTITNSSFTGNYTVSSSDESVSISALDLGGSIGTISSTVIAANQTYGGSSYGAAILIEYGQIEFFNCTIVNNTNQAPEGGALIAVDDSFAATNCIFRGNSPSQIVDGFGEGSSQSSLNNAVTYSIFQGGHAGAGNLDVDPLFIDVDSLDFQLFAGSPAIDAANGNVAPSLDRNGNPRFDDPNTTNSGIGTVKADIGAFEFQADSSFVQTLVLQPGWNLVSLPFVPTTPTITGLFGQGTSAFAWNPVAQDYEDISVITAGRGFYVYNDQQSDRIIYAYALSRGLAFIRALRQGWNVQGPIVDKLQPTAETRIIVIYKYNPLIDDYEQVLPSGGNYSLQTGRGYFMYCYPGFDLNL